MYPSKISTGIKQKADSGLHCEERQLLVTNTQSRTLSQHHHSYKSRAAAEFCGVFTGAMKTLGAACDFFLSKVLGKLWYVFCKGEKMYLKEQILSQQPHRNRSTTLSMSRARSYHACSCKRSCWHRDIWHVGTVLCSPVCLSLLMCWSQTSRSWSVTPTELNLWWCFLSRLTDGNEYLFQAKDDVSVVFLQFVTVLPVLLYHGEKQLLRAGVHLCVGDV